MVELKQQFHGALGMISHALQAGKMHSFNNHIF
jgi:hypothetical protein